MFFLSEDNTNSEWGSRLYTFSFLLTCTANTAAATGKPLEALKKITSSHWQMGLELLKHHPPVFTTDLSHGTNCSQKPRVLLGCPRKLLKGYKVAYYPNISHLYLDLPKGASQGHSVKCLPRCRVCLQI